MKHLKKLLAIVIALALCVGLLPTTVMPAGTAEAAGEATVVIAGSDYQNTNGGLFSNGSSTDAYAIMSQIKEDYSSAYGFLFGGDYYAHNTNTTTESTNGKKQLKEEIVDVLYPDMADDTQIYIQGNHDADSLTTDGTLATSGAHDTDYYGVYVINEKDYMWYNNDQTTIKNTASALEAYLDAKLETGYSKPIFVLSHLPLHYSNRTINEGDGKYAKYIYDVLDEAGQNDLNIIFMYGHNHSTSYYEEYLGNAAVYLAEGDTIYVANEGSQSSCFSDKLDFTYMNYGFTGYLTGTAADGALTMTVFEIYEDEVKVKRYDESGVHNLKSAGTNGSTPNGATYNSTVYTSPQTIKLTTPEAKATYTSNGVTVTAVGITAVTATKAENPTYNGSLYSGYEEYVVEATGYESGKTATVTISLTEGDFDTTRAITVKFPDGHTETVAVENGTIIFETDELGTFTLLQNKQTIIEGENSDTGDTGTTEPETKTIWRQVTKFTAGKEYLLVNYGYNANSSYATYAIGTEGHTPGAIVSVLTDSDGAYIETENTLIQWSAEVSTRSGYVNLKNVSSSNYLVASSQTGERDLTVNNSVSGYAHWNQNLVNSGTEYEPSIVAYQSSGNGYRFVRHSSSADGFVTYSSNSGSGKNDNWIAIFEKTEVTVDDGETSEKTYVRVDSLSELVSGEQYLFFFDSGNLMMTPEEYSNNSRTGMKYMDSPVAVGGETITGDLESYEFTLTSSGAGWLLSDNGQYVALTEYSSYDDTKKALTFESEGTVFTITGTSGAYNIYAYFDGSNTYFDENSRGMVSGYTYASGTVANFYIYRLDNNTNKPSGDITVTLNSDSGTVRQNAGTTAYTGSKLTLTYADGTTETVNVTVGMLRDAEGNAVSTATPGTYSGLSVYYTYNDREYTICDNYTLTVRENVQNNYPEYPDEGAVKVNKTATGIDFQSSGIAQVELSASGVPSKKGVDVIVMVDTSSSMKRGTGTNEEVSAPNRRIDFLKTALANLIREFQATGDDGEPLDINVAIAEFNGYSFISGEDEPSDSAQQGASNVAEVFTGDGSKTAGAFVQATTIADPDAFATNIGEHSGTNYDYAFDTIYRLGSAINAQNAANNEDRDLFVIFMSDGAPYGYNYYGSATTDTWDDYLNGKMDLNNDGQIVDDTGVYLKGNTHFYRTDGKHWMAEAVKGTTDQTYMVIDPADSLGEDATAADVKVYEDAGIILTEGETSYFRMVPGLGAEIHTIGFCLYDDDQGGVNIVTADTQKALMQRLASTDTQGNTYYHETESGSDLNDIFCDIASQIAYAANNARYVDQIGDNFNLQMSTATYTVVNDNGTTTEKTLTPKIEIISYDIYTRQDYLDDNCTEDQIGDRKGTYTVVETVTFNVDGTEAYSDQIGGGTTNILADGTEEGFVKGVIYAKTFLYNTNILDVEVDGISIPTGTTTSGLTTGSSTILPSETFYWKLGTVQTSELAMRYYVYLDGSMEGTKEAGSYATNEFAVLYYDNYLGNPCYKDTVSPTMAWKEANVSYAFYLVDENGNIIVNQTTGETGSFANKIAVTNPVVYETVLLNNDEEVSSIDIASLGVLPEGYTLYDYNGTNGATYTVTINSNTTGEWEITSVKDVATTYVMQYNPENASAYSNEKEVETVGYDYTHTVVWFAVLWKVQALPDAVVVDYGLPVDISVLGNDMFGENGKLSGVGAYSDTLNLNGYDSALSSGFGASYSGKYGNATANVENGKVRYTLNTMQMNGYDKFAYAVNFTGTTNPGYYYDTVTVIPATNIYYEDDFLTFKKFTAAGTENGTWDYEGTLNENVTQDEDRPGKYSLTDANNIYGYDSINLNMSTFSQGRARKVHVDADSYATAEFTFYGTGFDVVGMTSNTTGTIAVKVVTNQAVTIGETSYDADASVANKFVNTYYGYTYTDGEWVATPDTANALYQVPVLQIEELPYGSYTVTITATYMSALDKSTADGYDLYIDAVRIYDPANDGAADGTTDTTIEDAYKADGEGWPSYIELRNKIIEASSFDNVANDALETDMEGLVFIDGDASVGDAQLADYISYGPNNEVYLAPGQRVAFILNTPSNIANVHIGIKSADGNVGTYTITNIAQKADTENNINAGAYYNARTRTINTSTEMYYDLTDWKNDIIVISNTGDRYDTTGVISITNIKSTYTSDPNGIVTTANADTDSSDENDGISTASNEEATYETEVYMTPAAATLTLRSINAAVTEETPDDSETEVTDPEETVPEEPDTEVTEPDEDVSDDTNVDTSEPEDTTTENPVEDIVNTINSYVNKVVNVAKKMFGWLFR